MTCPRCRRDYDSERYSSCPECGIAGPESGILRTSTILIASGRTAAAYRSLEDVPTGLRRKLLRSTTGLNSGTILIADRRGREELAKAIRKLPRSARDKWVRATMGNRWAPGYRMAIRRRYLAVLAAAITLVALCLALVGKWLPGTR